MINYIPERIYAYLKEHDSLHYFNNIKEWLKENIDSCTSLTEFIEFSNMNENFHTKMIKQLGSHKDLITEYKISIGHYPLNGLEAIYKTSTSYENRMFALSHMLHSYSISDFERFKILVEEYCDLYTINTIRDKHDLPFYFILKFMNNLATYHFITENQDIIKGYEKGDVESIISAYRDICIPKFVKIKGYDRTNVVYVDIIEAVLVGCDYLLSIDYLKYKDTVLSIYNHLFEFCRIAFDDFQFITIKILHKWFLLLSSKMAENSDFTLSKGCTLMIMQMNASVCHMYSRGVPNLIKTLKLYDKNDIPMMLCMIRFLNKLKHSSLKLDKIIKLDYVPKKDIEFAMSDMDLHIQNHILSPVQNTKNDIDSWFEKATGVLRML